MEFVSLPFSKLKHLLLLIMYNGRRWADVWGNVLFL